MILCSGAFDGIHAGHVRYLQAARRVGGGPLIVAIAPTEYIRHAKQREPYWSQEERAESVAALRMVDDIVEHVAESVADTIRRKRPDYFVKGSDWRSRLPSDVLSACAEVNATIVFVDTPGRHVSEARG